jgi:hypothetical protein
MMKLVIDTNRIMAVLYENPIPFIKFKVFNPKHPVYSFRAQRNIRILLSIYNDV